MKNRLSYWKKYHQAHKKQWHDWYIENKKRCNVNTKKYYQKHKKELAKWNQEYQRTHKKELNAYMRKYHRNLNNKIKTNLRNRLWYALKGNSKSKSTMELLGRSEERRVGNEC